MQAGGFRNTLQSVTVAGRQVQAGGRRAGGRFSIDYVQALSSVGTGSVDKT